MSWRTRPRTGRRQRWEDVADVLRAGVDVVTTVNVAHLRSVRDYAARITGVGERGLCAR
jgi:two-component system, OmpR family, sensor histidine kinase KdpD